MLNEIYLLSVQDVLDFNGLNALPENNRGPQVSPMSYKNQNSKSMVRVDISGDPNITVPLAFLFSDLSGLNMWIVVGNLVMVNGQLVIETDENENVVPVTLDGNGQVFGAYCESIAPASINAGANTLIKIITPSSGINTITNRFPASASGASYDSCVDKTTIDNPNYQPWRDAMEANQPISERDVIIIML